MASIYVVSLHWKYCACCNDWGPHFALINRMSASWRNCAKACGSFRSYRWALAQVDPRENRNVLSSSSYNTSEEARNCLSLLGKHLLSTTLGTCVESDWLCGRVMACWPYLMCCCGRHFMLFRDLLKLQDWNLHHLASVHLSGTLKPRANSAWTPRQISFLDPDEWNLSDVRQCWDISAGCVFNWP